MYARPIALMSLPAGSEEVNFQNKLEFFADFFGVAGGEWSCFCRLGTAECIAFCLCERLAEDGCADLGKKKSAVIAGKEKSRFYVL